MLEAGSRLALSNDALFDRVFGNYDAAWRLRWVKTHADAAGFERGYDVHHPQRGWALRPNLRAPEAFGGRGLSTNSKGLRGGREPDYAKPPGLTRIVVLGDSFTFGEEVGDEETYAHVLGTLLPGVEVLNLGVHGYGHDQMLLYLEEEGVRYQPDVVLLGFVHADMERNVVGFRDFAKPRFELAGDGGLRLRNTPVPTPDEVLAAEPWRSKLWDLATLVWGGWQWRSGRTQQRTRELTIALLDAMRRAIESAGARPAYAYLPVWGELTKPDKTMTAQERFFFGYCRDRGVQSMYLTHFFLPKLEAGAQLKTDGHWGPLEHRTAAEGMKAYLLEKGLVASGDPAEAGGDGRPQAEGAGAGEQ